MKGVILVLMVLMAAVFFAALACGQNAKSIPGYEVSRTPATDADTKKMEDRMNEALSGLIIHRPAAIDNKITAKVSPLSNTSTMNSSRANSSSTNSSRANLPASSGKALEPDGSDNGMASGGTLAGNSTVDPNGIESNSKANFKGYYGITASQHEMGKNDIDSRMLLSGTFALDKSVKFQDRGV
ncbi:MAG TPA: hypothetical protein VF300_01510 [Methanothrix sp.]